MADIKIRFEVNPNQETERLGKVINENAIVSNVSYKVDESGEFTIISSGENDGSNGLSFAKDLVFDAQGFLDNEDLLGAVLESEDEPTEFVWGVVPSSKAYSVKVTFSNATNLKDIVVYGDKAVGQYPTRAIIDGKAVITNDDYKWAINLERESETHTIEFTHWSRADYNACLTLIRVMFRYFEVGKRTGLKTIESLSQLSGQPKEIYYGVIPSSGSVELIDNHGEFEDLLVDEVIPNSNLHLEVFANGRKIQNHLSIDSNYGNDRILTIELSNALENWGNIKFNGMKLRDECSLYDVLYYIFNSVGFVKEESELDLLLSENVFHSGLYVSVKEYLQNISVPYPYLEKGTFRDAVDKVCQLAQLNVVEDNNGNIKFLSARPIVDYKKPIITINPSQIKTTPTRDVILKNKYNVINVEYNQVENTYKSLDTRQITMFSGDLYVLSNKQQNPNISVLTSAQSWQDDTDSLKRKYSIIKYNIALEDDLLTKTNFKYKLVDSMSLSEGSANSADNEVEKDTFFEYFREDKYIISQWYNFDTYRITTDKYADVAIRKNNDNTITVYALLLDSQNDYKYNHAINFNIETISQSTMQLVENYDYSISSNELIQNETRIFNLLATEHLAQTISEDYGKGVATAEIDVICSDLYDVDGNLVKSWEDGETYDIGDILRIDKDKLGNTLWNYKDGSPMYWQVVSRSFKKTGVPIVSLVLRECKYTAIQPINSVSFAEDSWETIGTICSVYRAEDYYNIGDEKTIQLSTGESVVLQIWGFNHDNLTSGGKANITLGMKGILSTKYQMNQYNTIAGGWELSDLRTITLPQIFAQLPQELQPIIKFVDKECSLGDGTENKKIVSDNLFVFSEVEIYRYRFYTWALEGKQYRYWQDIDPYNNPKLAQKGAIYWLRSPRDVETTSANHLMTFSCGGAYVSSPFGSGKVGYTSELASSSQAICLGFCI